MFRSPALSSTEKASPPRRPPYIPALLPDSLRSALRMDISLMPHAKKLESLRIKPSVPRDSRHATFRVNPKVVCEPLGSTRLRGTRNYFFFASSRKDIAALSASQRPTPSSLCLPFPPARTGFPGRALLQRGAGGGNGAALDGPGGDGERPCGRGGPAVPFLGRLFRLFPTALVVFKALESGVDRREKEASWGGGRWLCIRPIRTQKWLPPPPPPPLPPP